MAEPYVKLLRKLLSWEWHDQPETLSVFVHCLLLASHKQTNWRGIKLMPGQFISGRHKLAETCGLSERQVRTCLDRLKATNEVTSKKTSKYTVFTVTNWKFYQQSDQQNVRRATSNRPAIDHNQEGKEGKEYIYPVASDFDAFVNKHGIKANIEDEIQKCIDWHTSKGTDVKCWKATVRTWLRNIKKWQDEKVVSPGSRMPSPAGG